MIILIFISYNAFLWDNDAGLEYYSSQLKDTIGTEVHMLTALQDNNLEVEVDTVLPPLGYLEEYDMLWINCAWRDDEMIKPEEREIITQYIDYGNCVYLEGNQVSGVMTQVAPEFMAKFGAKWLQTDPEIPLDIVGADGTFLQGEVFYYDSTSQLDNYVDRNDTTMGGFQIFGNPVKDRALIIRGTATSSASRDDTSYATVYGSTNLCALKSFEQEGSDREKRKIFVQKILGFFGFGKVLVVDDNEMSEDKVEDDLDSLNIFYRKFKYSGNPPPIDTMKKYNVVIWTTGYVKSNTITPEDTFAIRSYLDWGGRVLLAGEGICSEIGIPGYGEENPFLAYWFGTDYISEQVTAFAVNGTNEFSGISNELDSPDADELYLYSKYVNDIMLYDPDSVIGGIKKEDRNWISEFLGYAYEGMKNYKPRRDFIENTLNIFGYTVRPEGQTGIENEGEIYEGDIEHYLMFGKQIEFKTDENKFRVYSITGECISEIDGTVWTGADSYGNPLPSGIYLLVGEKRKKAKVVLFR